jgi:hypothetical protein
MEIDGEGELSTQFGSSQNTDLQEGENIFNIPPGQMDIHTEDRHMSESTNGGASDDDLGIDVSKPGSGSIGGPGAAYGGNKTETGGLRTSGRERKQMVRFNPNNSATY